MKTTLNPFENAKRTANGTGGGVSPAVIEKMQAEISILGSQNKTQAKDITELDGRITWKTHVENSAGQLSANVRSVNMPTTWKEALIELATKDNKSTTDGNESSYSFFLLNTGHDHYNITGYYFSSTNNMRANLKYSVQDNNISYQLFENGLRVTPGYISIYYR